MGRKGPVILWLSPIVSGLILLLGGAELPVSGASDQSQEEQLRSIEERLTREKEQYLLFDTLEQDLLGHLAQLEREVSDLRGEARTLDEAMQGVRQEAQKHEARLADMRPSFHRIENEVSGRLVTLYKHSRQDLFRGITQASDLGQLLRRIYYLRIVFQEDMDALVQLGEEAGAIRREMTTVEEQLARLENEDLLIQDRVGHVRKSMEEKVLELMKVHKEKEFYNRSVQELKAAAEDMRRKMAAMDSPAFHVPDGARFDELKGRLPLPVEGRILRAKDLAPLAGLDQYAGIFLEGRPGSEVRAVFPGEVVFSDWVRGYGELVILSHGSRFFTLSGNLHRREKKEGDTVQAGDILGVIGDPREPGPARLYFEVRQAEKNLDPREWLSVTASTARP